MLLKPVPRAMPPPGGHASTSQTVPPSGTKCSNAQALWGTAHANHHTNQTGLELKILLPQLPVATGLSHQIHVKKPV